MHSTAFRPRALGILLLLATIASGAPGCAHQRNTSSPESSAEHADLTATPNTEDRNNAKPAPDAHERANRHDTAASTKPEKRPAQATQADDAAALSVFDQGDNEIDLDLTQRIRKQLMGDDSLSFSAKNVQVISHDGNVLLRGTVKSEAEQASVLKTASNEAGSGRVTNALEVEGAD